MSRPTDQTMVDEDAPRAMKQAPSEDAEQGQSGGLLESAIGLAVANTPLLNAGTQAMQVLLGGVLKAELKTHRDELIRELREKASCCAIGIWRCHCTCRIID
jgi:hypothetical protein